MEIRHSPFWRTSWNFSCAADWPCDEIAYCPLSETLPRTGPLTSTTVVAAVLPEYGERTGVTMLGLWPKTFTAHPGCQVWLADGIRYSRATA